MLDTQILALRGSPTVSGGFVRLVYRAKKPLGEGAPAYGCRQSTIMQLRLTLQLSAGGCLVQSVTSMALCSVLGGEPLRTVGKHLCHFPGRFPVATEELSCRKLVEEYTKSLGS
jgi:hypothetical protein